MLSFKYKLLPLPWMHVLLCQMYSSITRTSCWLRTFTDVRSIFYMPEFWKQSGRTCMHSSWPTFEQQGSLAPPYSAAAMCLIRSTTRVEYPYSLSYLCQASHGK